MNKSLRFLFFAMLVAVAGVHADHMVYADDCCDEHVSPFFITIEGGYSASMKTTLKICDTDCNGTPTTYWPVDFVDSGTCPKNGFRDDLRSTGLVGVHFGYNWNCWFGTSFSAHHRGNYKYRNCYEVAEREGVDDLFRKQCMNFDLDNRFYAANLFINKTGWNTAWAWRFGCDCDMQVAPYAMVGVGWSRNKIFNFHVKSNSTTNFFRTVQPLDGVANCEVGTVPGGRDLRTTGILFSTLPYEINNAFGWQIGVGFEFMFNQCVGISAGYRYFDGGRFKTSDHTSHVVNLLNEDTTPQDCDFPLMVPQLCGRLHANEFVGNFSFYF